MIPTIGLMVATIGIVVCLYIIWRTASGEDSGTFLRASVGGLTIFAAIAGIVVLAYLAFLLIAGAADAPLDISSRGR